MSISLQNNRLRNISLSAILIILILFVFIKNSLSTENFKKITTITLDYDGLKNPSLNIIPHKKLSRPKIGLALSGGGLRGLAQVGVLKVLEENNIPVDYIVGTSIGAVIGGLYASGYTADEIWALSEKIKWAEFLKDVPVRAAQFLGEKQKRSRAWIQFRLKGLKPYIPEAYTPGQRLNELLTDLFLNAPFHSQNFTHLPIPLRIIATDLLTGQKIVFEHGDIIEAIRASIAIPLLFSPVSYKNMLLADGGLLDNIPVEETKKFGADIVIAVNTTSLLRDKDEMQAPWEMADQVTTIMQQEHNQQQLKMADVVISLSDVQTKATDSENIDFLFEEGVRRTSEKIDDLKKILKTFQTIKTETKFFIDSIVVHCPVKSITIEDTIDTTAHRLIEEKEVRENLRKCYQLGWFQDVKATVIQDSSFAILKYDLQLNPVLKSVDFIGNTIFPDSTLRAFFSPMLGHIINHYSAQTALKKIIYLYRSKGYSLAQIDQIQFLPDSTAKIYISEGKIHSINFTGHKITKSFVIAREFNLQAGQIFQSQKARSAIENVYATGLFRSVILRPTLLNNNQWDINLHLQETVPYVLRIGGKYDLERNGRGFLELSNENFLGTGNDLTLHTLYGDRDFATFINLRADRIFKTYFTGHLKLHYSRSKYYAYKNLTGVGEYERISSGATFSIGQQIARYGTLSGLVKLEDINIRSISGSGYDPGTFFIHTIGMNTIVDTRNQVPFPERGKYYRFSYQVSSGKLFGTNISFFQVQNQVNVYWTFKKRNTIRPSLHWGTSDLTTPFSEQFRVGGYESFYGLRDGELTGRHLILASIEYRYHLPFRLLFDTYLSLRFDAGAVWENVVEIKADDFINGRGISLSMKTPIGPLSFAYGLASNGRKRLYFSAGYQF